MEVEGNLLQAIVVDHMVVEVAVAVAGAAAAAAPALVFHAILNIEVFL